MGKFAANFFELAGNFSNIFESAAKFSKFENLPVAHHIAHALRVSFQKKSPATPPDSAGVNIDNRPVGNPERKV
jgi:hypothetical protein